MSSRNKIWILIFGIVVAIFCVLYTTKEIHALGTVKQKVIQISNNDFLAFKPSIK